jgi:probable HAF family extracellular repeat protein
MVGLGYLPNQDMSRALGVSGDGTTIVGYGQLLNGGTGAQSFSWTASTGMVNVGSGNTNATATNSDGSVVVGSAVSGCCGQAIRSTASGSVALPNLPGATGGTAFGVSGNGSTVVGYSYNNFNPNFSTQAFLWTASTGTVGLGFLPGAVSRYAYGISADGSTVVGLSNRTGDINDEAFRWTALTGMVGLGFLPGDDFSRANAVNADGSFVVGTSGYNYKAFVWTQLTGMQSIQDLLIADGLNLTGWDLISADGSVREWSDNCWLRHRPGRTLRGVDCRSGHSCSCYISPLRHCPCRSRSARLAQEAEGEGGRVIYFRPKSGSSAIRRASARCTQGMALLRRAARGLYL